MAFSEARQIQIRIFMGVPDLHRYRDSRLEDAIKVVGERPASQAAVEAMLDGLIELDGSLVSARDTAGMKRAEEVEWYRREEIESKRDEGRRLCARLSNFLGVPLLGDAFGTEGYRDDEWMGVGGQYGGVLRVG